MPKVWILVLTMCTVLAWSSLAFAQGTPELVHKAAPEFGRADLAGRKIDLEQYRGKVVLLNFWATWCASCRVELPKFGAWQKKYRRDGLQVLAVSMDDGDVPVRRVARKLHLEFPIVMGDAVLGEAYGGVLGLPVTFLIDRDGQVLSRIEGEADLPALEFCVRRALAH